MIDLATSPFRIFHLGAVLAYNINKYRTTTQGREKVEMLLIDDVIPKGSKILFSLGEIDCRVHVWKEVAEQKRTYEAVVDDIIYNYVSFLKRVGQDYQVYVWNAIPSPKDNATFDNEYPRCGTETERNIATAYFNKRLKEECEKEKFVFLSIFEKLVDEEYRTRMEYYCDGYHLSQ